MIQILYNIENANTNSIKQFEELKQQDFYVATSRKKSHSSKTEGMIVISIVLMIVITTILIVGAGSWNMVSEAMSQEEISLSQLPQYGEEMNKAIRETVKEVENNILKEAKVAVKELVVKKVTASDGKKYDAIAYLSIPSLGIKYPVLSKTSEALMKVSLNKYWGPNPNQEGNLCIVGHNYLDERFFGKLNQIKQGAEIIITEMDGEALSYYVYKTDMIDPYDTSCTSQLTDGRKEITLITCNVDGSQRFIVKARANQ